jgi:peptidoglycan/LPS O-acetylase OafA/YrhL
MRSDYRPDVDGLRAVAILAVLGFHAFPRALPGGFVGVDVFFVISGFLITRIIVGEIQHDTFTFRKFYSRRIRRIFPALAVVLAVTVLAGWLMQLPFDFAQLGTHIAAGAGFASNLLLYKESGDYFDLDATLKPLLHLWSLGVEEQYYIMWPLLLVAFRKRIAWIPVLICAIALGSFAYNVDMALAHPRSAFYLPQARFWELMIGSALAYASLNHASLIRRVMPVRSVLAAIGAALLVALINNHRVFPGWWALLPTVGTALLILAGPDTWLNRNVLASRVMVFVGLISYPLYLWHWPLLTYARIALQHEPSVVVTLGLLALAALFAWLTYEFLEKRVRHATKGTGRRSFHVVTALCSSLAVLALIGVLAHAGRVQARSADAPHVAAISQAVHDWEPPRNRVVPGDARSTVIFFGDSHMQQLLPRIDQVEREAKAPRRTVLIRTKGGCAPLPGIDRRGYDCDDYVDETYRLAERPEVDTIVIAASWKGFISRRDYYRSSDEDFAEPLQPSSDEWVWTGFETRLRALTQRGKRVVIVLSTPRGNVFDPRMMLLRDGIDFEARIPPRVDVRAVDRDTAYVDGKLTAIAERAGAEVVDPTRWVCDTRWCPTVDRNGKPYFKDDTHLRASFVREHVTALDKFIYAPDARSGAAPLL